MYAHTEDGTSDDFNDYGKGGAQHDDECLCARCEARWARLNARAAR